jgi:NAD(P)-dependent dehydrogenase (short-subunit alcohol dehydrogenase family)
MATAQALAQAGWHVLAVGLPHPAPNYPDYSNNTIRFFPADITNASAVEQLAHEASATTCELHGLVNCAGISLPAPLETLSTQVLRQHLEVNVIGQLGVIQALLPLLRAGRGRIINVSSVMGEVAMPVMGAYSMSKHALEAMTDVLRLELRPQGIVVCGVQMGAVRTPMTSRMAQLVDAHSAGLALEQAQRYKTLLTAMRRAFIHQEQAAVAPDAVAKVIMTALTVARPRARYRVGAAASGLSLMRRMAPEVIADAILARALGLADLIQRQR